MCSPGCARTREKTGEFRLLRFYALKTVQVVAKRNTAQFRVSAIVGRRSKTSLKLCRRKSCDQSEKILQDSFSDGTTFALGAIPLSRG